MYRVHFGIRGRTIARVDLCATDSVRTNSTLLAPSCITVVKFYGSPCHVSHSFDRNGQDRCVHHLSNLGKKWVTWLYLNEMKIENWRDGFRD